MAIQSTDLHVEYPDMTRHWHPLSERFAGGDALLTALQRGWEISGTIWADEFWHGGSRLTIIFYMTLVRGDEQMTMPVLTSPWVRRVMKKWALQVRPMSERDEKRRTAV